MNHKKSLAPFCGALMLLALRADAQAPAGEVISPGDARVEGSIIQAASNVWKMTGMTPGGNRTDGGLWKDKIEIVDRDGHSVIRRTQIDAGPDGTTTFITEADRQKLTPIRAEVTTAAGFHRVRTIDAWIVEVQDPVRLSRMIFSLTKQPPYIIRLQQISEGKFWTFDMV